MVKRSSENYSLIHNKGYGYGRSNALRFFTQAAFSREATRGQWPPANFVPDGSAATRDPARSPGSRDRGKPRGLESARLRLVQHTIRRSSDCRLADVCEDDGVQLRVCPNPVEHPLDPAANSIPQARPLALVEIEGFVELGLGLVAQDDRQAHRRALANARSLTSSHDVTASGRAMLSASRLSNS